MGIVEYWLTIPFGVVNSTVQTAEIDELLLFFVLKGPFPPIPFLVLGAYRSGIPFRLIVNCRVFSLSFSCDTFSPAKSSWSQKPYCSLRQEANSQNGYSFYRNNWLALPIQLHEEWQLFLYLVTVAYYFSCNHSSRMSRRRFLFVCFFLVSWLFVLRKKIVRGFMLQSRKIEVGCIRRRS